MGKLGLVDPWNKLHGLFEDEDENAPEITVTGVRGASMRACLTYLLRESRQLNVVFRLPQSGEGVSLVSVAAEALLDVLTDEENLELQAMFSMTLPALPTIGFYVDEPGRISISYTPGYDWNAMKLLALLELIRTLQRLAPDSRVNVDSYFFSVNDQMLFERVVQDYLDEQV
jgi:hypothetical protein